MEVSQKMRYPVKETAAQSAALIGDVVLAHAVQDEYSRASFSRVFARKYVDDGHLAPTGKPLIESSLGERAE
jgi:hypothetical protein